jgi:hypothetical protein
MGDRDKSDNLTRIHNEAESDYTRNDYNKPHGILDIHTTFSREESQRIIDENNAYDAGWDNARNQDSGGCFISTACARYAGLPDNCEELVTIRRFRDDFMMLSENGRKAIEEYYVVAPTIVEHLETAPDRDEIYSHLLVMIREAVQAVNARDFVAARNIYATEFAALKRRFLL